MTFRKLSDPDGNTPEGHRRCLECATGWGEGLTIIMNFVKFQLSTTMMMI